MDSKNERMSSTLGGPVSTITKATIKKKIRNNIEKNKVVFKNNFLNEKDNKAISFDFN